MSCGCGCCGAASRSRAARRRLRGLGRSRLAIGASAASTLVTTFDPLQYVPSEIQDKIATGASYYQAFSAATQGVSLGPHGTVQVSDGATNALLDTMIAAVGAAVPVLGAAFALIMAIAPRAGAGPGVCATSPPAGPLPSQLAAWPHFTSWASQYGTYPVGAPGTFEAYANPILEYNWLLWANCFGDKYIPPAVLLATLAASWNAMHASPPTRTITRKGLANQDFGAYPAGYDPIAMAMETAIFAGEEATGETFQQATTRSNLPGNVTSSLTVNSGPVKLKPLTLHFGSSLSKSAAPASGSSGSTAAAVAVVALGGAAAFFVSRSGGIAPALRRLRKLV